MNDLAAMEAGGIEPPTPPCKGGVFPLALRPRGGSSLTGGAGMLRRGVMAWVAAVARDLL